MINPFLTERERKSALVERQQWTEASAMIIQEFLLIRWMELENADIAMLSIPFHLKGRPYVYVRR